MDQRKIVAQCKPKGEPCREKSSECGAGVSMKSAKMPREPL